MVNAIKIFEIRKEIINKLKEEIKKDIFDFLLENPLNTVDFSANITAREKYHREKIGGLIIERDLTTNELKELYFSKDYNGNFFNEIIYEKIFKRVFFVKASKKSDYENFYKNKYIYLLDFLENIYDIKTSEDKSYYECFQMIIKSKTLEDVFEKLKEKKCDIYYETNINYEKKYKKVKNIEDFMNIVYENLNKTYKREIINVENCISLFYKDIENKILEVAFNEKEEQSLNPFGYKKVSNEVLATKIKNMRNTDFSKYLYEL